MFYSVYFHYNEQVKTGCVGKKNKHNTHKNLTLKCNATQPLALMGVKAAPPQSLLPAKSLS